MKPITKDQLIKTICEKTFATVTDLDGNAVTLYGYDRPYGDEQTDKNIDALIKRGSIVESNRGELFINTDHTAAKIAALQAFADSWNQTRKYDAATHAAIIRFASFPRCDAFGRDNEHSENHYVIDPQRPKAPPVWAPDVEPSIYTDSEINAEWRVQNAERAIAALEYAENVQARRDYFARLAGL